MENLCQIPAIHETDNNIYDLPKMQKFVKTKLSDKFVVLKQTRKNNIRYGIFNINTMVFRSGLLAPGIWPLQLGLWLKTNRASNLMYLCDWHCANVAIFNPYMKPFRGQFIEKKHSHLVCFNHPTGQIAIEVKTILNTSRKKITNCPNCQNPFVDNYFELGTSFRCEKCIAIGELKKNQMLLTTFRKERGFTLVQSYRWDSNFSMYCHICSSSPLYVVTNDTCIVKSCKVNIPSIDFGMEKVVIYEDII